jgi:hypothetical protein
MNLAVNYSPQAADLLKHGQIEFDLFKTPNWHSMVDEALSIKPVYVHFDLSIGDNQLSNVDWGEIQEFLDQTNTTMVNLHIVTTPDVDPCNQNQVETILDNIIREVGEVTARFGREQVIAENIPFPERGKNYLRPVT